MAGELPPGQPAPHYNPPTSSYVLRSYTFASCSSTIYIGVGIALLVQLLSLLS